jgi:hypothetical protein
MTKVTSKVNWAEIAESVEKQALKKLDEDLKKWQGELCDIGMREMFLRDAADTLAVCEIMDTAARDCVYEMIDRAGVCVDDFG